jgi:hypothetical protein
MDTNQRFKVSPVRLISPDKEDKSVPVFMEKPAKGILQRRIKIVPPTGPLTSLTVVLVPQK